MDYCSFTARKPEFSQKLGDDQESQKTVLIGQSKPKFNKLHAFHGNRGRMTFKYSFKPTSKSQVWKMTKIILKNRHEKPSGFIERRATNPTPVTS